MLPANIVNALQTLASSAKPALAPDKLSTPLVAKLETGQLLDGSIQSKLADGSFKVQVAGQMLQMKLPGNLQSGDTVRLQVVSTQPRITFSVLPSTNPISNADQIGSTARMLANLSDRPIERPLVQQLGDKAVWATAQAAPDVKQLASGLRDALSKSGLFYESHQAQWVRGERSTHQLLEEPQNLLTGRVPKFAAAGELQPQERAATPQSLQPQSAPTSPSHQTDGTTAIPRDLQPLVQQQLHTLENHHMVWMGQVWPGQQMQWEIQGEPEHQGRPRDERQWSTEMELSLPKLGDVRARLVFAERGLRLTLHADDSATAELFKRSLPQLTNALDQTGITLTSAIVERK